jgi:hypothetical protein
MKIIDNLVSVEFQNDIESTLSSGNFPWYFHGQSVNYQNTEKYVVDTNTTDTHQFSHIFVREGQMNSSFGHLIEPFLSTLELKLENVYRVQSNMLTKDGSYPENHYQCPHVDFALDDDGTTSLLYYVNDSDGDTFFFDGDRTTINRVTPAKGRAVMFKSNLLHAGSPPKLHKARMIINFVFNKDLK